MPWEITSRVEDLFHDVADLDSDEAKKILAERCADAPERRAAVEQLLMRERELPAGFLSPDPQLAHALVGLTAPVPAEGEAGAPLAPDERVGHFVVLERIGQGAAGAVYLARDEALDRRVALKVMHHAAALSRGATHEARALARLSHANVVRLYEVGAHRGRPFMAMEWISGRNLRTWLADATRSTSEILQVFLQAGRGLAAAHEAGLVHCDFKPENVLVGSDGRVCVADFGVAAFVAGDAAPVSMGTPAFMAPEQFTGDEVSPATDQFAFCVALYTALFGVPPFEGKDFRALRASVLAGALRTPERGRTAPAALLRTVERGLARDPSARFPSMAALLSALERQLPSSAQQEPARARRARRLVSAAILAIGGAALFALHGSRAFHRIPDTTWLIIGPGLALLVHAIAAGLLGRKLLDNPFSRRITALIWLGAVSVLVHRLLALRFGHAVAEIVTVDLLLLAFEQVVAALLLARWLGLAALFFFVGAAVALFAPAHALSAMLGSVLAVYSLPFVLPLLEQGRARLRLPRPTPR